MQKGPPKRDLQFVQRPFLYLPPLSRHLAHCIPDKLRQPDTHHPYTHTISPPASADQRPSRTDEHSAGHCRPRPSRNAKEQQQQSCCNEHAAQQLPQPVFRGRAVGLPVWLIPDFAHLDSPASVAEYARRRHRMHPPRLSGKKLWKDDIFVTSGGLQHDGNRVK